MTLAEESPSPAGDAAASESPAAPAAGGAGPELSPENLPPVEPPSAGFILQLFVVPAIIVAAVIGIWLMFGKLASSDQDWQRQVDELRQSNAHRRWRAGVSLAQMLQADQLAGEESQHLAENPEVARAIAEEYRKLLQGTVESDDEQTLRAYLVTSLGWLDVDEVTVPALIEGMEPNLEFEVRNNSLTALCMIAGRRYKAGTHLDQPGLLEALLESSSDSEARIRLVSAAALGLLPSESTAQRLSVMLEDSDELVRVNAALALAHQKSTAGLDVLVSVLDRAANEPSPLAEVDASDPGAEQRANADEIELIMMARNAVQAVSDLAPQFTEDEVARFRPLLQKLGDTFREPAVKVAAKDALKAFAAP